MQRPRRVVPGESIAVIAPSSAPRDPQHLTRGIQHLRELGFRVEVDRPEIAPVGYLAGSDDVRLDELNRALRRTDISAIFCVRGGFGSMRLLEGVDYEAAAAHPKLLIGYSDVTALYLALYRRTGIPSVAGAMVASDFDNPHPESLAKMWDVLRGVIPLDLDGPSGEPLEGVRSGVAEGPLLGGNLTLIARLMGTPYLPPLDGAILFFEEIGEEPYRLDGLLAQLKLAGVFERVAGVVVGAITEWEPKHTRPTLTLDEVLDHYLSGLPCPVARGLRFGHIREKVAVPVGVRARLEVDGPNARLTVLESVVRV
ncbi:MAG TPA: LD-carboxypeptidase [Rhodothermales bacterium]